MKKYLHAFDLEIGALLGGAIFFTLVWLVTR